MSTISRPERTSQRRNRACSQPAGHARGLSFSRIAKLGLFGSAWSHGEYGQELDLIASLDAWADAAFETPPAYDRSGRRVIPLAFFVLMKLDSARGIDQADLNRVLGRLSSEDVKAIIPIVEKHYDDPVASDDIRQLAEIGRWEYNVALPSEGAEE
jgi:hypothetical protein